MKADTDKWFGGLGEHFLKGIGLHKGQAVLDFGCGSGAYALPAAQVVGNEGRVYALDKDRWALDQVKARARSRGLGNITCLHSSGELKIPLEEKSVDAILLYDVIHSWYFTPAARQELLNEIYRVARPNAVVSVYPSHMDLGTARRALEEAGFCFERRLRIRLLHNGRLVVDDVLNFRKRQKDAGRPVRDIPSADRR